MRREAYLVKESIYVWDTVKGSKMSKLPVGEIAPLVPGDHVRNVFFPLFDRGQPERLVPVGHRPDGLCLSREQFGTGHYVVHEENRIVVYRSHRVVESVGRSRLVLVVVLWRVSEHDEPPEDLFVRFADELLPLDSLLLWLDILGVWQT